MSESGSTDEITGCPHCGKRFHVRAGQIGKGVNCRKCGQPFRIRAVSEVDELEELSPNDDPVRTAPAPLPPPVPMRNVRPAPAVPSVSRKPVPKAISGDGSGIWGRMTLRNKIGLAALILVILADQAVRVITSKPSREKTVTQGSPAPARRYQPPAAPSLTPQDAPADAPVTVKPAPRMTFTTDSIGRKLGTARAAMRSQSTIVELVLPPGEHASGSLPCVFVCPAGSNLVTGTPFDDGEREDYYGLLEKGIAVCFYSLDGTWDRNLNATERQLDMLMAASATRFLNSGGGLANVQDAIDTVLAGAPAIDASRLGAAGHSSAGTVALTAAKHDERIAAVGAMAPAIDLPRHLEEFLDKVSGPLAGAIYKMSPSTIDHLDADVFIFAAADDTGIPKEEIEAFAAKHGDKVTLRLVPVGGHSGAYEAGRPAVFEFFAKRFNATAIAGAGKVLNRHSPQVVQSGPTRRPAPRPSATQVSGTPRSPVTSGPVVASPAEPAPSVRPAVKVAKLGLLDLHSYGIPDGFEMTMSDDGKMFRVMNTIKPAPKRWGLRGFSVAADSESPLVTVTAARPGSLGSGRSYVASDGTISMPSGAPNVVDGMGGQFAVYRFNDTEQDVPTREAVIAFETAGAVTVIHIAFPRADAESLERFITMLTGWEIDRPAGAKPKAYTKTRTG